MGKFKVWMMAGVAVFGLMSTLALAQPPVKVRGTITGFDGHVLKINTRDGNNVQVNISDNTGISSMFALQVSEIKQGSFVGVTAIKKDPAGGLYALEVHVFPENLRGMGEGHRDWDLEPGSTMTNANIDAVVEGNDGKQLTLSYKGGEQKIIVSPGTPVVTFAPGDKLLIKVGAQIFLVAKQADDGSLTAQHIQVGKDGLKPPM